MSMALPSPPLGIRSVEIDAQARARHTPGVYSWEELRKFGK